VLRKDSTQQPIFIEIIIYKKGNKFSEEGSSEREKIEK
jgi:hypothetical protein